MDGRFLVISFRDGLAPYSLDQPTTCSTVCSPYELKPSNFKNRGSLSPSREDALKIRYPIDVFSIFILMKKEGLEHLILQGASTSSLQDALQMLRRRNIEIFLSNFPTRGGNISRENGRDWTCRINFNSNYANPLLVHPR